MTSVCVPTEEGGVLSACARTPDEEAPVVLVAMQLHGAAMQVSLSHADALTFARAIERCAAELAQGIEALADALHSPGS